MEQILKTLLLAQGHLNNYGEFILLLTDQEEQTYETGCKVPWFDSGLVLIWWELLLLLTKEELESGEAVSIVVVWEIIQVGAQ